MQISNSINSDFYYTSLFKPQPIISLTKLYLKTVISFPIIRTHVKSNNCKSNRSTVGLSNKSEALIYWAFKLRQAGPGPAPFWFCVEVLWLLYSKDKIIFGYGFGSATSGREFFDILR